MPLTGLTLGKIVRYSDAKIQELMANERIIRHRLKIESAVTNARAFLDVTEKYGCFDKMIWEYVNHTPVVGHWKRIEDIPTTIPLSDKISKDLKKMGFKFVGSTIIYSFMQAVGMVNDHLTGCFVYEELLK